jgi:peptide chain release factor 1
MQDRLHAILDRFAAVEHSLNDPAVANDARRLREASREYKALQPIVDTIRAYLDVVQQLGANRELIDDPTTDAELRSMAHDDSKDLEQRRIDLEDELRVRLIPRDPNDMKSCIVEVRAGTGGEEAALFAGDLFRMYQRYCDTKGWHVDVIDFTESERGGFKEITFEVQGDEAYGVLKYESGVHRVQRVPETEASGRIHTSAATVAVLPEAEEVDVDINDNDLRIDIFRSGGKGGQNVNKVETAVRIVHLPSGIVVQCQDERSQLKNREKAMKVLRARLYELELEKQHAAIAGARKSMVKSGDRSEKIRTYNWPQNRVTDHRLEGDAKNSPLQQVIDGDLDPIIEALRMAEHAERVANSE